LFFGQLVLEEYPAEDSGCYDTEQSDEVDDVGRGVYVAIVEEECPSYYT